MLKEHVRPKKARSVLPICVLILPAYAASYGGLRLSKQLVHQEVAIVEKAGLRIEGRAVCYTILHDIGRGSYVDENNFNAVRLPGTAAKIGKWFYYPFVKLEVAYWELKGPQYIFETTCSQ